MNPITWKSRESSALQAKKLAEEHVSLGPLPYPPQVMSLHKTKSPDGQPLKGLGKEELG